MSASAAPVRSPHGKVIGAVLVFQDVTDSRAPQRELAHTAMHDSLTGLPNRAAFERALTMRCEQARRELREHALCFIDLDRFKLVNDNAGHAAGDALLRYIGGGDPRRLPHRTTSPGASAATSSRCSCRIARSPAQSVSPQQIIDAIAALRSPGARARRYDRSAPASASPRSPAKSRSTRRKLMSEADAACYVAKANGRNQVAFYDGEKRGLDQLERSA